MDHRVSWTGLRRPNRGWPHLRRVGMVRSATERGEPECVGRIRPFRGEFSDLRTNRFDRGRPHASPICFIRPTRS